MDNTFIDELKQELRQDRVVAFWRQYKLVVYLTIGLIIVGTAGGVWWKNAQRTARDNAGNAFFTALHLIESDNTAQGIVELDAVIASHTGYAPLAVAKKAALLEQQGKYKEAADAIGEYLPKAKGDDLVKELLMLQQARYVLRLNNGAEVPAPVSPKLAGVWEEYRALVALQKGDKEGAKKHLAVLESDNTAPVSLRSRARDIAQALDPAASSVPASVSTESVPEATPVN